MSADLAPSPWFVDGEVSWWFRERGLPERRAPLPGDLDVDVAVVGGGFTGLWTAYYLKEARPDLRVAVLEREFCGFGASGRNGGWVTSELPGHARRFAAAHGVEATVRMQREMFRAVDEVGRVASVEGIDAHVQKDGMLRVATTRAQLRRLVEGLPEERRFGWGPGDLVVLARDELDQRVRVQGALGAAYSPHCARVQPARLVTGLADAVERRGVRVFEATEVLAIGPGLARTRQGDVRAPYVIRALEGFTAGLPGLRRSWLPMSSSMVVTEPLPDEAWAEIGWKGAELVGDEAHAFAYAQRTRDGRIALGGRAVPYRFGSRTDRRGETLGSTVDQLRAALGRLFPPARAARIEHAWSGVLAVPRDWCATVGLDRSTGLGWAGGYVGHGVTSTNLAGRTLADLVLGRRSELTALPWVDRAVRRWEPEPLRWLGVRGLYAAYRAADRLERAGGGARTSLVARAADRIAGQ